MTIAEKFAEVKEKGEKGLVLFVTAGDPDLDSLPQILKTLEEAGADVIEVGIPFSDPIADGPTIQASSQRALDRGTTPGMVLEKLLEAAVDVPVVLMGYMNTAYKPGYEAYAKRVKAAGATGTIMCDLIPEESEEWAEASKSAGLDTIFLAAPTSTDERLDLVTERCSGFVYAVSRTGVTGARAQSSTSAEELVGKIQARTELPVCVGFGISTPEHVREVCEYADGVVIGSTLVDLLANEWKGGEGRDVVVERVRAWKAATRG